MLQFTLDRSSSVPLYRQIVERVRELIETGTLPAGFRLPPERKLAEDLGINRSTVLAAYRGLKELGLVDAHVGRGTIVAASGRERPSSAGPVPWGHLFAGASQSAHDPVLRDLLELTERHDVISLAAGLPAPELLPVHTLRKLFDQIVEELGPTVLLHCPTEGHSPLRESLSRWLESRGIHCAPEQVLVLSGSQQGLDLAARTFVDPGDVVVVEEPSYVAALQVFRAARARLIGVPVDEDGLRVDMLASVLQRHRPKLIYTLPTFQNPSGAVMPLERRKALLELAGRHGIPILEDDPYSELRYDGQPVPSLKALDREGIVLYLSTVSKVLFPGMRLGFLVAPEPVVRRFALLKQGMDLHSNSVGQFILDRFIRRGLYGPYLAGLRESYVERRDTMDAALREAAVPGLHWRKPAGGFYIWCRLPESVERGRLMTAAADEGVAYLPGRACFVEEPEGAFARLNFSYPSVERIREGVVRFARSVVRAGGNGGTMNRTAVGTPPIV